MASTDFLKNEKVLAIIREGFTAFEKGQSTSPYPRGNNNYWWHQGYEAAAIVRAVRS